MGDEFMTLAVARDQDRLLPIFRTSRGSDPIYSGCFVAIAV
jgi:hypothetical protein